MPPPRDTNATPRDTNATPRDTMPPRGLIMYPTAVAPIAPHALPALILFRPLRIN